MIVVPHSFVIKFLGKVFCSCYKFQYTRSLYVRSHVHTYVCMYVNDNIPKASSCQMYKNIMTSMLCRDDNDQQCVIIEIQGSPRKFECGNRDRCSFTHYRPLFPLKPCPEVWLEYNEFENGERL